MAPQLNGTCFSALEGAPSTLGIRGENHRTVIGNGDGVLVVRGGQVIVGRNNPTVGARAHMVGTPS